jgi:hypothetical protein
MMPEPDGILQVVLILPDGSMFCHSVRFSAEPWQRSANPIRDVRNWLEAAAEDIAHQLRAAGTQ